jgi:transcription elongation factor Elf1
MPDFPTSLIDFQRRFLDEAACAAWLFEARWPAGFRCPACAHEKGWPHGGKPFTYECAACGKQTSVTAGTIMHGSKLSLTVWLCDQRRLACSAGDSPAGARIRSPVVWIAGWRETKTLKPIDKISLGEITSHRAVTKVNAEVASKSLDSEGRAHNQRAKAAWVAEI